MDLQAVSTRPARPLSARHLALGAGLAVAVSLAATPARAGAGGHDDCAPNTRHARAEYQAAHERSKQLGRLDCAGLTMYTERQRHCFNQWILSTFLRPVAVPASPTVPDPAELSRPDEGPPVEMSPPPAATPEATPAGPASPTPPPPPPPAERGPGPGQSS